MGKKYIIELEEPEMFDERKYYQCSQMPWWAVSENIVENLTPYAEPDMEQVRKEGYEQGYENGFIAGHLKAEKSGQSFYEDGYKRGLADAWEAARKIASDNAGQNYLIFGQHFTAEILNTHSASECIEKIRQYEQEKEEQIQVGDEIETPSGLKGYVVNFTDDELVHYVSSEGRFGTMGTSAVSKTGRHFPEIAKVLQKMKES